MAEVKRLTVTIASGGTTGSAYIQTQGRSIAGIIAKIPTVTGAITTTIKHISPVWLDIINGYLWKPAGLSAKSAGTYTVYPAGETADPKPGRIVPTANADNGTKIEVTSDAAEGADREIKFIIFLTK